MPTNIDFYINANVDSNINPQTSADIDLEVDININMDTYFVGQVLVVSFSSLFLLKLIRGFSFLCKSKVFQHRNSLRHLCSP